MLKRFESVSFGNIYFLELTDEGFAIIVEKDHIERFLTVIKYYSCLRFEQLIDCFAVDYPDQPMRFQLNYLLLSMNFSFRVLLRCLVGDSDGDSIKSVKDLYVSVDWAEREIWDLFGVFFVGSVSLRRILTDYGFIGHPLRRDFPLTGFVAVRWSFPLARIVVEPVVLTQDYRFFEFENPWVAQ